MSKIFCVVCRCVLLLSVALRSLAAVTNTGITVQLNGVYYYSPPHAVGQLAHDLPVQPGELKTVTVVTTAATSFDNALLSAMQSTYTAEDDVWQKGFSDLLHIQYTGAETLATHTNLGVFTTATQNQSLFVPNGPYFMSSTGALYEAHRLYTDSIGAFTETVTQDAQGSFSVLPANSPGQNLAIAVPSRLYYTKTADKPLAGVRVGVKDIFDIKDLKTSNGNRAWYHLYPPANETGPAIQGLLDAGAIIVGKLKTSQFANGERATADWVDYHEPFNPRGDGYQDTSGSSAGPGAAVAAYDFLDLAVGSDTGGSVREPAQVQGILGNRPTHGLISLDKVMTMAPELDTAGLLARDPSLLKTACHVLYKQNFNISTTYPKQILALDFPTTPQTAGEKLLDEFLKAITAFLNAKITNISLEHVWQSTSRISTPLKEYLNLTYPVLISQHQIQNIRDPFYRDYGKLHDGRIPFVDPVPLSRWKYGEATTATISAEAAKKENFKSWFETEILKPDPSTCSDKLLLYTNTKFKPAYRNKYHESPTPPFGFELLSISIFSGTPDVVVPVGETEFWSNVTEHVEVLPVTVDIMAARGCDGMVLSLVEELYREGIVKVARAGGSVSNGGEILVRRSEG
ncbi:glutamyl-tRNA amidotransferase [Tothia fuscella]|uniref:Glutamyl-tRNA amidotransferase n=1 Tax=Tothia fuscella TaxID=1048955 RepID=A0A9P4U1G6_9PEZI|nr:glutamyl-tRNA amidotransferase [Tothia fuscella]